MKHLLLFAVVLAMATTAFGSSVTSLSCGTVGAPTSPCTLGDKDFTDFVSSGFPDASISVTELIPNRQYVLNLDAFNAFNSNFTFTYTVSVNGACATCKISDVAGSMSGQSLPLNATLTITANGNTSGPTTGAPVVVMVTPPATSVDVSNSFMSNGGSVTRISNTIVQTSGVPEPLTLGLAGLGLAVFGLVSRRKLSR